MLVETQPASAGFAAPGPSRREFIRQLANSRFLVEPQDTGGVPSGPFTCPCTALLVPYRQPSRASDNGMRGQRMESGARPDANGSGYLPLIWGAPGLSTRHSKGSCGRQRDPQHSPDARHATMAPRPGARRRFCAARVPPTQREPRSPACLLGNAARGADWLHRLARQ